MPRGLSRSSAVTSLLAAFLVTSVVLGLLGAGVLLPVVGLGGGLTKAMVSSFDSLPREFTVAAMAQQSKIYANDGKTEIATLYEQNRQVVSLRRVAKVMQQAQLAIEDDRFYEHGGIDTRGIVRAFLSTLQNQRQGASTITQQFVRQTLVNTALRNEDEAGVRAATTQKGAAGVIRKIQEAKYAISLEQKLTKDQILQGYMNIVFYGAGAYGVEAAALRYFGVNARNLNLQQAATLAGLVQQPSAYNPLEHPDLALKRRNLVLNRMYELKMISSRQLRVATRSPLGLKVTTPKASCLTSAEPYICDYIVKFLLDQPSLGADQRARERTIKSGLRITTTLDMDVVRAAKRALQARASASQSNRGAAAATVEPGTGKVIAIAQSSDYKKNQVNWAVDYKYGASTGFQIGSTAKIFALVTALKQGWSAYRSFYAPPDGTRYSAERLGGTSCGMSGSYGPGNAESNEHGVVTLQHATAASINTAFLALAAEIGVCNTKQTMIDMGLHTSMNGQSGDQNPNGHFGDLGPAGVILGADNASPLTLAAATATLPAGGKYCEPNPIEKIEGFDGTPFEVKTAGCKQVIDGGVAYDATRILQTVMRPGGTASNIGGLGARPAAGKTGTSDSSKQTWFVGYTPQRSTAVWYGTPRKPRAMGGIYGATIAAPLWKSIMTAAHQDLPVQGFRRFRTESDDPNRVEVPDVSNRGQYTATNLLREAGFTVVVSGMRVRAGQIPAGRVAYTQPAGGNLAQKGSRVTIYLSRGVYIPPRPTPTSTRSATPTRAPSTRSTPSTRTTTRSTPPRTPTPAPDGGDDEAAGTAPSALAGATPASRPTTRAQTG